MVCKYAPQAHATFIFSSLENKTSNIPWNSLNNKNLLLYLITESERIDSQSSTGSPECNSVKIQNPPLHGVSDSIFHNRPRHSQIEH